MKSKRVATSLPWIVAITLAGCDVGDVSVSTSPIDEQRFAVTEVVQAFAAGPPVSVDVEICDEDGCASCGEEWPHGLIVNMGNPVLAHCLEATKKPPHCSFGGSRVRWEVDVPNDGNWYHFEVEGKGAGSDPDAYYDAGTKASKKMKHPAPNKLLSVFPHDLDMWSPAGGMGGASETTYEYAARLYLELEDGTLEKYACVDPEIIINDNAGAGPLRDDLEGPSPVSPPRLPAEPGKAGTP